MNLLALLNSNWPKGKEDKNTEAPLDAPDHTIISYTERKLLPSTHQSKANEKARRYLWARADRDTIVLTQENRQALLLCQSTTNKEALLLFPIYTEMLC